MDIDPATAYRAMLARDARFDGRFFTGVVTTGVYCRPVCPARPPKPGNCRYFPSAAAAQDAGFRPCLRCRPETAPDIGAWRGSSNTVARALALIEAGALDDGLRGGGVEALGDRLGVGARQLRRLFRQHLGASPVAVAQTARVLLAKQLIHDSELSMAQVAFAAGFGSVRRFNETFQALYRRPPGALRRRSVVRGGPLTLLLHYRPPYDWTDMLSALAAAADPAETIDGVIYVRTFDGGSATVRQRGEALTAAIELPRLEALPRLRASLRRRLDLAADPLAIAAVLSADPRLAAAVARWPGRRVPGDWDAPGAIGGGDPAWQPWGAYGKRYLAIAKGDDDALAA